MPFLSDPFFIPDESYPLLVTPEHRGTFLPSPGGVGLGEFDQLITSLPTATGGSLIDVDVIPDQIDTINPVDISEHECRDVPGYVSTRIAGDAYLISGDV